MMGPTHVLVGAGLGLGASAALGLDPLHAGGVVASAAAWSRAADDLEWGIAWLMPWRWRIRKRRRGRKRWRLTVKPLRHRWKTHRPLAPVVVGIVPLTFGLAVGSEPIPYWLAQLAVTVGAMVGLGAAIGYAGHLFADGLTLDGVPMFSDKPVHFLPDGYRFRVGGAAEHALAFVLCVGLLAGVALRYAGT